MSASWASALSRYAVPMVLRASSVGALAVVASVLPSCGSAGGGAACAPNCEARIVSHGLGPRKLAVDDQSVYWIDGFNSNDQTIRRAPRSGGDSTTLTTGKNLGDLVLDGATIYYSDESSLKKIPKQGGPPETLAQNEVGLVGLAVSNGQIFWSSTNGVRTMPTAGGAPKTIVMGTYAGTSSLYRVVVDAANVYWPDNGSIYRAPRAGGGPIKLRGGPGVVFDLALDGGDLYFAMGSNVSEPGVFRIPIDGGTPTNVGAASGDVQGIALETGSLYWSDTAGGAVMGPRGQIAKSTRPGRIAVSKGSIFWVDDREAIVKAVGP